EELNRRHPHRDLEPLRRAKVVTQPEPQHDERGANPSQRLDAEERRADAPAREPPRNKARNRPWREDEEHQRSQRSPETAHGSSPCVTGSAVNPFVGAAAMYLATPGESKPTPGLPRVWQTQAMEGVYGRKARVGVLLFRPQGDLTP